MAEGRSLIDQVVSGMTRDWKEVMRHYGKLMDAIHRFQGEAGNVPLDSLDPAMQLVISYRFHIKVPSMVLEDLDRIARGRGGDLSHLVPGPVPEDSTVEAEQLEADSIEPEAVEPEPEESTPEEEQITESEDGGEEGTAGAPKKEIHAPTKPSGKSRSRSRKQTRTPAKKVE